MPIRRTYMCQDCGYYMEVQLTLDQYDTPAPNCPACDKRTAQEFKPVSIRSQQARHQAENMVEDILAKDYHVANIHRDHRPESTPKVRYNDQTPAMASTWGAARGALESAMAAGRSTRMKYGSGLDVLQTNLKNGSEPDLIEISKRRAMRVY